MLNLTILKHKNKFGQENNNSQLLKCMFLIKQTYNEDTNLYCMVKKDEKS